MAKTLIKPRELPIGRPLPWNIYDQDGTLMFARGVAIDPETKARIFKPGLLRDVNVEEGELVTERINGAADQQAKDVRLAFSETGVRPGDAVHLVRDLDGTRLAARLIGYLKSKSIIITVPADEQGSIYLKAGESVVVKVFSGKHVLAFPCTVLAGCVYIMKPACLVKAIRANNSDLLAEDILILGQVVSQHLAEARNS